MRVASRRACMVGFGALATVLVHGVLFLVFGALNLLRLPDPDRAPPRRPPPVRLRTMQAAEPLPALRWPVSPEESDDQVYQPAPVPPRIRDVDPVFPAAPFGALPPPLQVTVRAGRGASSTSGNESVAGPAPRDAVDVPPRPLHDNARPRYPFLAERHGWEGTVRLRLLVGETGRVEELEVARLEGHSVFQEAAIEAARTWRFLPAERDGRPVRYSIEQEIRFALGGP